MSEPVADQAPAPPRTPRPGASDAASPRANGGTGGTATRPATLSRWVKGLLPLALLAVLLVIFFRWGPLGLLETGFPPVEELTIERVWLPEPGLMKVRVVNGGPEPVTLSQVVVDDAIWSHAIDGERTLGRLESRTLTIPYPWVEGEPHEVALLTTTGLTFTGGVEVATVAPEIGPRYLGTFALIGIYVGVLPVLLGLLWLPFLRVVERRWVDFFLAFTLGLLAFLGVDALVEAMEVAERVPGAFQGTGLILLGAVGTPLVLEGLGGVRRSGGGSSGFRLSLLIALAIGLHNMAEGLAIGTSYASGAIALGTFLVVGFLVHNTTEGLAIVAPLARERPGLGRLALLGLLAGVPTILGAWIGAFGYSPLWTTLFLAVGAGAVAQVVLQLGRGFGRRGGEGLTAPLNVAGILLGLLVMYGTGLLVAA